MVVFQLEGLEEMLTTPHCKDYYVTKPFTKSRTCNDSLHFHSNELFYLTILSNSYKCAASAIDE